MWGVRRPLVRTEPDDPVVVYPFNEDTTLDDVYNHPWPDPNSLDYSQVKSACERYNGEYALVGSPWSPFFHEVGWTIGQENYFIWMHTKPEVVKAITNHIVDYEIEATRQFLEAADGMIDIMYFGNDYGSQRALVISPAMWNEFLRQPQKRYFDISHDFGCKVMFHSCGSVRDIIPALIQDGVDVLDPIQVRAQDMELAELAAAFGHELSFHGALDTQHTLPFGSEGDVRRQARSYLDLFRDTGGYILCGSQSYVGDIPLENILVAYEENMRGC